jgi:hypothetical protein
LGCDTLAPQAAAEKNAPSSRSGEVRQVFLALLFIAATTVSALHPDFVSAQTATLPIRPNQDTHLDLMYPDAVICNIISPEGIDYKIVFYKSQTISFANEPNNAAEYGTTFIRDPGKFDSATSYKWRLQLGKPGNITVFTPPSGWSSGNCPVGKSVSDLC